ncbi:MAG: TlpA family protein disulfide reductase [Acidimicrobiales bacterium]
MAKSRSKKKRKGNYRSPAQRQAAARKGTSKPGVAKVAAADGGDGAREKASIGARSDPIGSSADSPAGARPVPDRSKKRARSSVSAREEARMRAARKARQARLQWAAIIGVGVLIVGGVLVWSIVSALPEGGDTSAADWDLPALANDPDGDGRLTLAELSGTPVVANFYADWCVACEAELPGFSTVAVEMEDRVTFVGINSQETGSRTRLPEQFGTDWWPLARDINGSRSGGSGLWEALGNRRGMPITAFFDAEGRLVHVENGAIDEQTLRALIQREFGVT